MMSKLTEKPGESGRFLVARTRKLLMLGAVAAGVVVLVQAFFEDRAAAGEAEVPAVLSAPAPAESLTSPAATELSLQVGQQRMVMLHSNAGTGYVWQLEEDLPADSPVSATLTGVEPDESNCCGFPVPVTLTLTAERPGRAELRLIYVRPWERDKAPAKQEIFCVEVKNPEE